MPKKTSTLLSALILFSLALFEAIHDVTSTAWPGLPPAINLIGLFYIPFWTISAIGLVRNVSWGWVAGFISSALLVAHGTGINTAGSKWGNLFIIGGCGVGFFLAYGKPWLSRARDRRTEDVGQKSDSLRAA